MITHDRAASLPGSKCMWERYAATHRLQRISSEATDLPLPKKIRIYRRRDYFLLQWWDTAHKRTSNLRVDGDLITAIAQAREIEEQLAWRPGGGASSRIGSCELIRRFVADLERRADAGELAPSSASRICSALRHVEAFLAEPVRAKRYQWARSIDRGFRLELAACLEQGARSPAAGGRAVKGPLRDPKYVLDTCRSLLSWATDPKRGALLPHGFPNPFEQQGRRSNVVHTVAFGEPDITTSMAIDLLRACDAFQLPLFATLILYGLRPSELTYLFREPLGDGWVHVDCLPGLGYFTKGRLDKRFPKLSVLTSLWRWQSGQTGLLFQRRDVENARLLNHSLAQLEKLYRDRCAAAAPSASERESIRDQVLHQAGALDYDRLQHEFARLATRLGWPRAATLKDLRHLFSTSLENAGVPEFYRKYLMGHSLGRAPNVGYTHLNALRQQYQRAIDTEFQPIVEAIHTQARQLVGERAAG